LGRTDTAGLQSFQVALAQCAEKKQRGAKRRQQAPPPSYSRSAYDVVGRVPVISRLWVLAT
jgi:hypothetical protein